MICHEKSCLMGHIMPFFGVFLTAFVGMTIICWKLFSLTRNIFIPLDMAFPHLYIKILLIGLDAWIMMILDNLKCCLWNVVMVANPHFVTMQNWNWNKKYFTIAHLDILVWIFDIFPLKKSIKSLIVLPCVLLITFVFKASRWKHIKIYNYVFLI